MKLFTDRRSSGMLQRVSEDVSQLRDDIGALLGHTTRTVLPEGAREVSKIAREQLEAGKEFALSRWPLDRSQEENCHQALLGSLLLVGSLVFAAYLNRERIANAVTKHLSGDGDSLIGGVSSLFNSGYKARGG